MFAREHPVRSDTVIRENDIHSMRSTSCKGYGGLLCINTATLLRRNVPCTRTRKHEAWFHSRMGTYDRRSPPPQSWLCALRPQVFGRRKLDQEPEIEHGLIDPVQDDRPHSRIVPSPSHAPLSHLREERVPGNRATGVSCRATLREADECGATGQRGKAKQALVPIENYDPSRGRISSLSNQ